MIIRKTAEGTSKEATDRNLAEMIDRTWEEREAGISIEEEVTMEDDISMKPGIMSTETTETTSSGLTRMITGLGQLEGIIILTDTMSSAFQTDI